jgi:hypothetical protein
MLQRESVEPQQETGWPPLASARSGSAGSGPRHFHASVAFSLISSQLAPKVQKLMGEHESDRQRDQTQ